jgi:hypothetical protein
MIMSKDEQPIDLIDLGVATEETKGGSAGTPEDHGGNHLSGISDE